MLYDQEPKTKIEQGSEETKEESYLFMKETIKSSRKKDLIQIAKMAFGGLLFGLCACCGFFALKPWAERTFYKETELVNIPEDEEPEEEETVEIVSEAPILSAESYEEIMQSMYDIAQEAEKSLVNIQSVQDTETTLEEATEGFRTTGTIVADNGAEYLILADDSICEETNEWNVTFVDHKEYKLQLKERDKNRGIAIFSVDKAALKAETKNTLKVSQLGNSNVVHRGDVVIALGDMFGYEGAVGYGIVSSVEHEFLFADGVCGIIATDIEMASNGSGVLVNQSGEIIGLLKNNIWKEENHTVNALAISDLKAALQLLLNGKGVPYLGTHGIMVTEEIAKEEQLPIGFYVTQVDGDSPAMQAGIQVGDIIQKIADAEILSMSSYQRNILNLEVGEEVQMEAMRRGAEEYVEVAFKVVVKKKE